MFPERSCLSGFAPLKPIIVLKPVPGWPAGLSCHSSSLTLPTLHPHPHRPLLKANVKNPRFTTVGGGGWSHFVSSFLTGSWSWLWWQRITSSLLEGTPTNHIVSEAVSTLDSHAHAWAHLRVFVTVGTPIDWLHLILSFKKEFVSR